jgi:protein SCO1/2
MLGVERKYNGPTAIIRGMNLSIRCRGFADRSILFVLVAALTAGLGLMAAQLYFVAAPALPAKAPLPLRTVTRIEPARAIAPFRLDASNGGALTPDSLQGRWTLVFFGFTHCPDVCPTTLTELAGALRALADMPTTTRPRVLFVSVDPERDTAKLAGDYARYFHPDFLAATAQEPALAGFARSLGMVYMKSPLPGGDYSMDHSATLVLLDPQGRQAGLIRPPLKPQDIASDLRLLSGDVR